MQTQNNITMRVFISTFTFSNSNIALIMITTIMLSINVNGLHLRQSFCGNTYELQNGDTLNLIASKFRVSRQSIISLNGLTGGLLDFTPGLALKIPCQNDQETIANPLVNLVPVYIVNQ